MFIISCVAGIYLSVKMAERQGVDVRKALNTMLIMFVFGIAGARIVYLVRYAPFFYANPLEIFAMWKGGFTSYGGILGSSIGAIFYLKKVRIPIWKFADICAPSVALGIFFTRIGCFMNGCCFGKACTLPWAVGFPKGSNPFLFQAYAGKISLADKFSLPVHPTQLYYSLTGLVLFVTLLYFMKHKRADGQLFLGFILFYSVSRFIIEFSRENVFQEYIFGFSRPQMVYLIIIPMAAVSFFIITKMNKVHISK